MSKALRFIAPIAIAVVLGPLIAGVAVSLFAVGNSIFSSNSDATVLGIFPVYIMLAYAIGAHIELLAELMVSIWMLTRAPSFLVVIAAAIIATCLYMGIGALGGLGPAEFTNRRSNFAFTLVSAVFAAGSCWLLTRRFARRV
jgi:hypothetical protein